MKPNRMPVSRLRKSGALALNALVLVVASACAGQEATELDTLDHQYQKLCADGQYQAAISVASNIVQLARARYGDKHAETGAALRNLGYAQLKAGHLDSAEPLLRQAIAVFDGALGSDHPDSSYSWDDLCNLYEQREDFVTAEKCGGHALQIVEKAFGTNHADTASVLSNLGTFYGRKGDYAKSLDLLERALSIRTRLLGPTNLLTAGTMNNLAMANLMAERLTVAEDLFQRVLGIITNAIPGGVDTEPGIAIRSNLGDAFREQFRYLEAEPLLRGALDSRRKRAGTNEVEAATEMNNLALLLQETGDYEGADALAQRALALVEESFGAEATQSLDLRMNFAALLYRRGESAEARRLLEAVLADRARKRGPDSPGLLADLINLAVVNADLGEFAAADNQLRRALNIARQHHRQADAATLLHAQANLLYELGDFAAAEQTLNESIGVVKQMYGPETAKAIPSLNSLANVLQELGRANEAIALLEGSVRNCETAFGTNHPTLADTLNNLGLVYRKAGRLPEARLCFERALGIDRQVAGPQHPKTATVSMNLGTLLQQMGQPDAALPLVAEAADIARERLGRADPRTGRFLDNLGFLYLDLGRTNEALALAHEAQAACKEALAGVLAFAPERQRLTYQSQQQDLGLLCTLGDGPGIAAALMWRKGIVADSLLEDRRLAAAAGSPNLQRLEAAKAWHAQITLTQPQAATPEDRQRLADARGRAETDIADLERTLAREFSGLGRTRAALERRTEDLQAALPAGTVYVEFVRYPHDLGRLKKEPRYGAVVVGQSGPPQWVRLESASEIERNLLRCGKAAAGSLSDRETAEVLRALHAQVWSGLSPLLGRQTREVVICPDAELNFLPFGVLLTPGDKFLEEELLLRFVSSGRDLLSRTSSASGTNCLVVADPDFGQEAVPPLVARSSPLLRSLDARSLDSLTLPPLPGTAAEARAIKTLATNRGLAVTVLTGAAARESALREAHSPRILHLATHGFFLASMRPKGGPFAEQERGISGSARVPESTPSAAARTDLKLLASNPMLLSGLALAGARTTLGAWRRGEAPAPMDDGLLTAEEVGTLTLDDTWLVALSACETGVGEVGAGEGVLGLRRGFALAGARHLLLTLWPVRDEPTAQFMGDFYKEALASGDPPTALTKVQRDWLSRLRHDKGLAYALSVAGPFIISSRGTTR